MTPTPRPLGELLRIIDAKWDEPRIMERVVAAFTAKQITTSEARRLQSFEKQPPKSRKRALAQAKDVSPQQIEAMKAKLNAVKAKFDAMYPQRHDEP